MGRAGARHWTPPIGLVRGLRGYANQSLSHVEPVSGSRKRKLKNGEQRLAPENYRPGSKSLETTSQRRGRGSLTRGNVDGYSTPGNHDAETALGGWGIRIRTSAFLKIYLFETPREFVAKQKIRPPEIISRTSC